MKKSLIFTIVILLTFSFLFTGCEEDAATGLTDDDVSKIAMSSMSSGYIPSMLIEEVGLGNGEYGPGEVDGDIGGMIVSGTLTVLDGTYTFDACALDLDTPPVGGVDVTLGGAFSVEVVGSTTIITLTALNLTGIMPGTTTVISVIVSGTHTVTSDTWSSSLTLSGITAEPCDIVIEMTMDAGEPEEVTSATINGVDYTAEFNTALAEL